MGAQVGHRVRHPVKQKLMQTRLIDDAVLEFRHAKTRVGDLVFAFDVVRIGCVRLPERVLHQLVGFFFNHFSTVKGFHDFDRTTGNAICATEKQRAFGHIHDTSFNIAEL